MQDPQCSTPEAAVLVQIECSLKEKTQKWEIVLKKSLQSLLFSKDLPDNTELCHLDISPSNPFVASVVLNSMPGKKQLSCPAVPSTLLVYCSGIMLYVILI